MRQLAILLLLVCLVTNSSLRGMSAITSYFLQDSSCSQDELIAACTKGDLDGVRGSLVNEALVNSLFSEGKLPLHEALSVDVVGESGQFLYVVYVKGG